MADMPTLCSWVPMSLEVNGGDLTSARQVPGNRNAAPTSPPNTLLPFKVDAAIDYDDRGIQVCIHSNANWGVKDKSWLFLLMIYWLVLCLS